MNENVVRPSKAEELFYSLKKLAGSREAVEMEEVRLKFSINPAKLATLYTGLKKLEEHGAIERVMGRITHYGRESITEVRFLKDQISIPQGKRGRKPGSKNAKKEVSSSVQVAAPQISSAPVPKQLATPLPVAVPVSISVPNKPQGVVVFIDENQVIALERDGRKLNFPYILEKVKKHAGEKIERVFFYCSEATEKYSRVMVQSLFRLDSSILRVIKTGSQPGVVDKRIREDIYLWSRVDLVSTIVLVTADGGPDFLEAIDRAKNCGKKLILLKLSGEFNRTLSQLADGLIDASTSSLRRRPFEQIVLEAKNGNLNYENHNTQFVTAIAICLKDFFQLNKEAQFGGILEETERFIREIRLFDGFTDEDMREALDALIRQGHFLTCDKQFGKSFFRLTPRCDLLDVLEKKFPAHSQA